MAKPRQPKAESAAPAPAPTPSKKPRTKYCPEMCDQVIELALMWDDQPFGAIGIPALQQIRGDRRSPKSPRI